MSTTSPTMSWPRGAFSIAGTVGFAIGAVAVAILAIFIYLAVSIQTGHIDVHHPHRVTVMTELIGELVIYIPVGAYLLTFLPAVAKRSLRDLGIRAPGWREIGIGFLRGGPVCHAGAVPRGLLPDPRGIRLSRFPVQFVRSLRAGRARLRAQRCDLRSRPQRLAL